MPRGPKCTERGLRRAMAEMKIYVAPRLILYGDLGRLTRDTPPDKGPGNCDGNAQAYGKLEGVHDGCGYLAKSVWNEQHPNSQIL